MHVLVPVQVETQVLVLAVHKMQESVHIAEFDRVDHKQVVAPLPVHVIVAPGTVLVLVELVVNMSERAEMAAHTVVVVVGGSEHFDLELVRMELGVLVVYSKHLVHMLELKEWAVLV